jgi:hypothetical protein
MAQLALFRYAFVDIHAERLSGERRRKRQHER